MAAKRIEERDGEQGGIPDAETADDFANLARFTFFGEAADEQAGGHQIDPLPEGVAAEIEEASAIVRLGRLGIERTVILYMMHVDVLHAIKTGNARGQQPRGCIRDRIEALLGAP